MAPKSEIDLTTLRLLNDPYETPQFLSVTEPEVRLCMDPMFVPDWSEHDEAWDEYDRAAEQDERLELRMQWPFTMPDALYFGMLRTGAIFALDPDEVVDVISQLVVDRQTVPEDLADLELPPLPFARVLIEGRHDDKPAPLLTIHRDLDDELTREPRATTEIAADLVRGTSLRVDEPETTNIELVAINEQARGQCWQVLVCARVFFGDGGGDDLERYHFEISATEDGLRAKGYGQSPLWLYRRYASPNNEDVDFVPVEDGNARVVGLAITLAQLVTIRNVRRSEQKLPRAQRRALTRLHLKQPPRVYFVDLSAAGDRQEGVSDREYHVRWLVRGHWRRSPSGSTFVRAKGGICSWVSAHVKGPPGAPWKGRPVHRS